MVICKKQPYRSNIQVEFFFVYKFLEYCSWFQKFFPSLYARSFGWNIEGLFKATLWLNPKMFVKGTLEVFLNASSFSDDLFMFFWFIGFYLVNIFVMLLDTARNSFFFLIFYDVMSVLFVYVFWVYFCR